MGGVLLADDVGVGKTLEAFGLIATLTDLIDCVVKDHEAILPPAADATWYHKGNVDWARTVCRGVPEAKDVNCDWENPRAMEPKLSFFTSYLAGRNNTFK